MRREGILFTMSCVFFKRVKTKPFKVSTVITYRFVINRLTKPYFLILQD